MVEFFPEQAVFVSIGDLSIRWYGIAYVAAFWIAWALLPGLGARRGVMFSRDQWTRIVAFCAFGALAGGRLGYAILYEPAYFLGNPGELIRIWHGGMSSHGGFIGAAAGVWMAMIPLTPRFTQRKPKPSRNGREERTFLLLAIADAIAAPAALGLAIGRLANIANGEFGTYPLYEAAADFGIAVICWAMMYRSAVSFSPIGEKARMRAGYDATTALTPTLSPHGERGSAAKNGEIFAAFLILYSIARFSLEYIRVQEWPILWGLSFGQLYTIPLFLFGMLLLAYAHNPRIQSKV